MQILRGGGDKEEIQKIKKLRDANFIFFRFRGLLFLFEDAIIYNCHRQSGAIMLPATISLAHPRRAHPEARNSGHDTGETQNRWGISTVGRTNYHLCTPAPETSKSDET